MIATIHEPTKLGKDSKDRKRDRTGEGGNKVRKFRFIGPSAREMLERARSRDKSKERVEPGCDKTRADPWEIVKRFYKLKNRAMKVEQWKTTSSTSS